MARRSRERRRHCQILVQLHHVGYNRELCVRGEIRRPKVAAWRGGPGPRQVLSCFNAYTNSLKRLYIKSSQNRVRDAPARPMHTRHDGRPSHRKHRRASYPSCTLHAAAFSLRGRTHADDCPEVLP